MSRADAMTIDWSTLALQAVNFLVLAWLLRRFLYDPVLAVIDRRRGEVQAARDAAASAERRAGDAESEWRRRHDGLEAERRDLLRGAETEAAARAEAIAAEARANAESLLAAARAQVARERREAARALGGHAAGVAATLAGRLLEQVAPTIGAAPFLEMAAARLDGRRPLAVETWPPLSAAERESWRTRLGDVAFADAPGLVAGARLILPSAVVEASWAAALAAARSEMAEGDDHAESG
jgi:F-type H+-transporting ATPase subunit b